MTKKKRTVSRRYNQKKRYKQKKLTNKKKRGGSAAAEFRRYQPSQREETVKLDKLVLRLVLSEKASSHGSDELKKDLISYLKNDLFKIFKNVTWFKNVTIDHDPATSNRLFFVQIPKDQWTQKTYQNYKEHVEELIDTISRSGSPTPRINDNVIIQEMTIDRTWIKDAQEEIIRKQRREQALIDERRRVREVAEEVAEEEARGREREAAAVKIQSGFRGSQGRDVADEERVRRDREDAILQIQKRRRGKLGRKVADEERVRRDAVLKIQKIARGKRERDEVRGRKDAALRIQKIARGQLGRKRAEEAKEAKEEQARTDAILQIQKMRRGKRGRDVAKEAKETRDRRILESRRIFWTDEKGEINTRVTEGIEGDYGVEILGSLNREETRIPIILKISDEVEVRGRWSGDSWKTGTVTSTYPSIKVRVNDVENFENWPIVRLKDPEKRNRIQEYITELEEYVDIVGDDGLKEILDRTNRSKLLLGEEIDCDFSKGNESNCNLNPKCRYVSGNYGELNEGDCFTTEEIIQQLEPFIQELEGDAVSMPYVETYDDNIRIYKALNKILIDTTYDGHISRTEQMKNTLNDKTLKEGEARIKRERREERKEEILKRMQRMNEGRKALGTTMGEIKDRFVADEKNRFKQLKKSLTKKKKPKKKIDRVITETKVDLRDRTVNYTLKQKKNKKPIHDVKKDYMKFVDDYYKTAIQKDKIIINRFIK